MDENKNITHEELSELLSERKDPARQIAILEAGLANANAEVAALRERVAELEEAARWIPVSERLPDWEVSFEADTTFGVKIGRRDISEGYVTDGEYTWEYTHWRYITPPEAE